MSVRVEVDFGGGVRIPIAIEVPRIAMLVDRKMPPNTFELRSGEQRRRVRWPDEAAELERWLDDGGASCE